LARISRKIIAASNQKLSKTIFGYSYITKAGCLTGAFSRFRDLNGATSIGKGQCWPAGLDMSGFNLIKASAAEKGKARHLPI
jgi:hypothetical protein